MPQPTIQQTFDLAGRHYNAGRLKEAQRLCHQILAGNPEHPQSTHLLGVIALQVGRYDIALDLFRKAITLKPNWPEAHNNLGVVLKQTGQIEASIAEHRLAISLNPNSAAAHFNLGNAHKVKRQFDQAIAAYRRAIELDPICRDAHFNLANALKDSGQVAQSIALFHQAIAVNLNHAEAYNNLAVALKELGQLDASVAACQKGIALKPDGSIIYNNLGNALKDQGRLDDAIAAYRRALDFAPHYAEAHSNIILTILYHPDFDDRAIAQELQRWNSQHAEPLRRFIRPHLYDAGPDRRLRIGYVSPDFRDHVVGRNLIPLFRNHDHRHFEIFCYANVLHPDEMTRQFQKHADAWRDVSIVTDEQTAHQIREDRIDILVDLALHTASNRLMVFAQKPAPVQVTFAGYPGSTGLTAIDYRLSNPYLDPPGKDESIYTETTIRLSDSFWCFDPLDCRDIPVDSLPAEKNGYITFGCLNNFCKINATTLTLWARVLHQVENSRLLLLARDGSHRQRVMDYFSSQGIPAARIEFLPYQLRPGYLAYYHRIDITLDTYPYNGHTTSLDSLWMGVPVVTLAGPKIVSRAGLSQLSNLGLANLVAHTPEQFVEIAVNLSREIPTLSHLRIDLRAKMEQSPLMNAPKFAQDIESAYRQIWQTWCKTTSSKT